jgi:hypothetical protein
VRFVLWVLVVLTGAWACAAVWFDGPASRPLAGSLAAGYALVAVAIAARMRPLRLAAALYALLFFGVVAWWLSIAPSNDRVWEPSVARPARAQIEGDLVIIENVRDFDYRSETDFTERWETRSYDLSKLRGFDMFLSYWGSPWIAHTIASWEFEDGQHLAVSIETRKEVGEFYSAVRGFFRQFELYYVVADERDVARLRTNYRGEEVYLYRLTTPVPVARALLLDYLNEINELAENPRWYNALFYNCTTGIRRHAQHVGGNNPLNWRILVNGKLDEMGYMRGTIDTSLPFAELRRLSNIVQRARAADQDPEFSERIREGLPGRR